MSWAIFRLLPSRSQKLPEVIRKQWWLGNKRILCQQAPAPPPAIRIAIAYCRVGYIAANYIVLLFGLIKNISNHIKQWIAQNSPICSVPRALVVIFKFSSKFPSEWWCQKVTSLIFGKIRFPAIQAMYCYQFQYSHYYQCYLDVFSNVI